MASKQQVAVADIINTLLATNQRLITKQEALQCFDQVFRQAREADQVLDQELTQAYVSWAVMRVELLSLATNDQATQQYAARTSLTAALSYQKITPDTEITSSQRSSKRRKTNSKIAPEEPSFPAPQTFSTNEPDEIIRCVCNSELDNGAPWICCENCSVWQHMNCMRLFWTAEEAEKHKYMCEKCAPAQHWDVLTMLENGTWDPLPFKSIEDEMDQWEEDVGTSKIENKRFHQSLREIDIKAESESEGTPPVSQTRSIQMVALQQRLQDARSDGNRALAARIAADIRNLEDIPVVTPSRSPEAAPLQSQGVSGGSGYSECEEVDTTGAAHGKKAIAGIDASAGSAASGENGIVARDRRHSINGGVGADILLPANTGGPIEDKQTGRAQEPYTPSSNNRHKDRLAETPPAIDPTIQQLGRQAAGQRSA